MTTRFLFIYLFILKGHFFSFIIKVRNVLCNFTHLRHILPIAVGSICVAFGQQDNWQCSRWWFLTVKDDSLYGINLFTLLLFSVVLKVKLMNTSHLKCYMLCSWSDWQKFLIRERTLLNICLTVNSLSLKSWTSNTLRSTEISCDVKSLIH